MEYVRTDNWLPTYQKVRSHGNTHWINSKTRYKSFILFPALNPNHLFPLCKENPAGNGQHGYVDDEGFVRSEKGDYTGWRAINFFPYAIFTPLSGSVSGIYIRIPREFMCNNGNFDVETYNKIGVGITPTGIVEGDAIDSKGNFAEEYTEEHIRTGRVTFTGTLDLRYNPILSGIKLK